MPATRKKKSELEMVPSVKVLKESLVALWEYENHGVPMDLLIERRGNKTSDGIRKDATKAARLSSGECHFCGSERERLVEPIDWSAYQLCACLADMISTDTVWHLTVPGVSGLIALVSAVDNRQILDSVPILTQKCGAPKKDELGNRVACDTRWTLRSGTLAHAVRTYLKMQHDLDNERGIVRTEAEILVNFTWPRRCRECRAANKARLAAQGDRAAPPTSRKRNRPSPSEVMSNILQKMGGA